MIELLKKEEGKQTRLIHVDTLGYQAQETKTFFDIDEENIMAFEWDNKLIHMCSEHIYLYMLPEDRYGEVKRVVLLESEKDQAFESMFLMGNVLMLKMRRDDGMSVKVAYDLICQEVMGKSELEEDLISGEFLLEQDIFLTQEIDCQVKLHFMA